MSGRLGFATALALLLASSGSGFQAGPPAGDTGARELLQRLESAWRARDVKAYLALWEFATVEAYEEERRYAEQAFAADESQLQLDLPPLEPGREGVAVNLDVFSITEPRGRVDQWLLSLVRRPRGWTIVNKESIGQIDGLIHLTLDPTGYNAAGMALRFEDFELQMSEGSLFLSPQQLGPTLLVFVGSGELRFRPAPEAEREQLRQFCGRPELIERIEGALVRLHPADFHRVLEPAELVPDPGAARRLPAAQRLFREQGSRAFVLEQGAPRSPWWLLPSVGDSAITFETRRRGTLTFAVSDDAEGLSLFDRDKRRYICLYPRAGRSTSYSEDDGRAADILEHDLRVRFDPAREALVGEDTLRIDMLAGTSTLRLKLDDALRVESVSSPQAGRHLFFRVRNQDSLMISLGSLSGLIGEIRLTVRYSGVLRPGPIEQELLLQGGREGQSRLSEDEIPLERVLVYTNREAWYPQGGTDDFATARVRFDLPLGFVGAVTGGTRTEDRIAGDRRLVEYVQDRPGRYVTAAVGRLQEVESLSEGGFELRAFAVPRLRGEATSAMRLTSKILRYYSGEFGPAPYPRLNLVLTEGYTPGGHSPPGMVLLVRRPALLRSTLRDDPASFPDVPEFHLAHELAHQWWGHGVAPQNYRERWLSEATAQYAAALWVRHSRGEEAFQGVLRQLSRWALKHTALGPIHLGYRLGQLKGDAQIFRAIVYDKGAYVLHMLRALVGPQSFREALVALQAERRFQKVGSEHLRAALEKASGRALQPYFEEWIEGTRLPTLRVSQRAVGGGLRVDVAAVDLPGPVPLEIEISAASGTRVERVTLDPAGGTWTFPAPPPARAEINPNRELLASVVKG